MADDRTVKVTLRAEVGQYTKAMGDAERATRGVGSTTENTSRKSTSAFGRMLQSAERNRGAWEAVGRGMLAVGAATAAVGAAALKTGIEYNTLQQTSRAALTTLLGSAEAANAQMDKLDEFAKTSPFAKQTFIQAQQQMLAFGIETQKVIPYLDAVQEAVAAAGGSNADIEGIVATMSKIQSSSKITAQDLNEFGNRGVNAAELIGSQMGMTGAQIREEITAGSLDATQALDALAAGMKENFDGASENVKQTFAGAMDRVKAAWRDFAAELATPLVDPNGGGALVDLLNWTADMMRGFESLPGPVKTTTTALAGLVAVVGTLGGAFALLVPRISTAVGHVQTLRTEYPRAASAFGKMTKALGVLAGAFTAAQIAGAALGAELSSRSTSQWTSDLQDMAGAAEDAAFSFEGFSFTMQEAGFGAAEAVERLTNPSKWESFEDWSGDLLGMASNADALRGEFEGLGQALAAMHDSNPSEAQALFNQLLAESGVETDVLLDLLPAYRDALLDTENATKNGAAATDGLTASTEASEEALQAHIEALNAERDALSEAASEALGLRDAQRGLEAAIDDASASIEENGKTLDITTEAGRANQAALDNIASSGWDLIDQQREQGATEQELQSTMRNTRRRFIEAAEAAGMSSREARNLADQLGLIPKNTKPKIDVDTGNSEAKIRGVRGLINGLNDKTVTLTTYSRTVFSSTGHRPTGVLRTEFGGATGGLITAAGIRGFADGGLVPGTPPSNPMADNLLATNENGTPFAIRSREFIQSQPAVDHYGVAAMAAINARKVPKAMLQGFAAGGQVPGYSAGSAVATAPNVTASIGDVSATIGSESMRAFAREVAQATLAAAGMAIDRQAATQDQRSRYVTGVR